MAATTQEVEAGSVEEASLGTVTPNQLVEADPVKKEAFLGTVAPTQQVEACRLSGGSLPGYCDLKKS